MKSKTSILVPTQNKNNTIQQSPSCRWFLLHCTQIVLLLVTSRTPPLASPPNPGNLWSSPPQTESPCRSLVPTAVTVSGTRNTHLGPTTTLYTPINQSSIMGGIRRGARCLAYPTAPLLVTARESPCRLPSHTE